MALHGSNEGGGTGDGGDIALRKGTTLFAATGLPEADHEARDYIRAQKFTREDVKLIKRGDMMLVIAERDLDDGER
jgi:hypothetical protein